MRLVLLHQSKQMKSKFKIQKRPVIKYHLHFIASTFGQHRLNGMLSADKVADKM